MLGVVMTAWVWLVMVLGLRAPVQGSRKLAEGLQSLQGPSVMISGSQVPQEVTQAPGGGLGAVAPRWVRRSGGGTGVGLVVPAG